MQQKETQTKKAEKQTMKEKEPVTESICSLNKGIASTKVDVNESVVQHAHIIARIRIERLQKKDSQIVYVLKLLQTSCKLHKLEHKHTCLIFKWLESSPPDQ